MSGAEIAGTAPGRRAEAAEPVLAERQADQRSSTDRQAVADNRDDDRFFHRRGKRRVVEESGRTTEREPDSEVEPAVRLLKENMIITAIGSASQMISSHGPGVQRAVAKAGPRRAARRPEALPREGGARVRSISLKGLHRAATSSTSLVPTHPRIAEHPIKGSPSAMNESPPQSGSFARQELVLDDCCRSRVLRSAEDGGVHVVGRDRDEREQHPGEQARQAEGENDPAERDRRAWRTDPARLHQGGGRWLRGQRRAAAP